MITSNSCSHWKLSIFKNENFTYELSDSCKHFIRLIDLSSVHLKPPCQFSIFIFYKNKQGIYMYLVSNFHPRLEKRSIIWEIWNVHPRLKFHLGLAKPSWNLNSVNRIEIFTCNCNVILKRGLLFNQNEISTRFNKLKFHPG